MFSASAGRYSCCGMAEIGKFKNGEYNSETPKGLIQDIESMYHNGTTFIIWFVKFVDSGGNYPKDYEYAELKKFVSEKEGVTCLPERKNPNTNNKIEGYIWVNQNGSGNDEESEDDDF